MCRQERPFTYRTINTAACQAQHRRATFLNRSAELPAYMRCPYVWPRLHISLQGLHTPQSNAWLRKGGYFLRNRDACRFILVPTHCPPQYHDSQAPQVRGHQIPRSFERQRGAMIESLQRAAGICNGSARCFRKERGGRLHQY